MAELEFRQVVFDNLVRFEEIFEQCFGFKANEDYFRWKYLSNPEGEVIAFEAFDPEKNKVAAFYGVMPEAYIINGESVKIYQSMDTMTHPDYRNRGLFIKLANMTYDFVEKKEGAALFIGIPGSNSFYGFVKKLGWDNPINIKYIFNHTLMLQWRLLFSNNKSLEIKVVENFEKEADHLFKSSSLVSKKLNSDILNWKFSNHPLLKFHKYVIKKENEIVGVAILEVIGKDIRIMLYKDNDASGKTQRHFIKEVSKTFRNSKLYTWDTEGTLINNKNRSLFISNPFSKGFFSYRVPFISLIKGNFKYSSIVKDIRNFDLYPGIQD